jgi:phospholipid/cholesterol/gamma-HCH transport system substrate-binding protein
MKLSNETKVGILAIVAILILVLGFNFLKGQSLFSKPPSFFCKFAEIGSLEKSNPVKINGLAVGTVFNITQADKTVDSVVVEIRITRDVLIPKTSIAFIDGTVLGTAFINIEKPTEKTNLYYTSGDTINTRLDKGLFGTIQSQLQPTLLRVNETLDSLKMTLGAISGVFDPHTKNNMQDMIANLAVSSLYLQQLLNAQTGQLAQALKNMNSVTANLAKNNDAITNSIHNLETTTGKLATADIDGTIKSFQGAIAELKTTIANLNSKNGSLGLLMNDRQLYDNLNRVAERLNRTALSAEITLDDLRANPKRYVNFSVFGKKAKGEPLSSPARKDTVPK